MHYPNQQHKVHDPVEPAVLSFLQHAATGRLSESRYYHDLRASVEVNESPLIEVKDESPPIDEQGSHAHVTSRDVMRAHEAGTKISLGDYDYTTTWFRNSLPALAAGWIYEIWLFQPHEISYEAGAEPGEEAYDLFIDSLLETVHDDGRDYAVLIDWDGSQGWVSETGEKVTEIHVGYL